MQEWRLLGLVHLSEIIQFPPTAYVSVFRAHTLLPVCHCAENLLSVTRKVDARNIFVGLFGRVVHTLDHSQSINKIVFWEYSSVGDSSLARLTCDDGVRELNESGQ